MDKVYLSGDIYGDSEYSNVEIVLNSDVQVLGNLKIGENVILNGQGYDLIALGNMLQTSTFHIQFILKFQ